MDTVLENINPQTIALLEENARRSGVSVDDYLQSILPEAKKDLNLKRDVSDDEFEADMKAFADEDSNEYQGTYSREDIYFDHD